MVGAAGLDRLSSGGWGEGDEDNVLSRALLPWSCEQASPGPVRLVGVSARERLCMPR